MEIYRFFFSSLAARMTQTRAEHPSSFCCVFFFGRTTMRKWGKLIVSFVCHLINVQCSATHNTHAVLSLLVGFFGTSCSHRQLSELKYIRYLAQADVVVLCIHATCQTRIIDSSVPREEWKIERVERTRLRCETCRKTTSKSDSSKCERERVREKWKHLPVVNL